MKLIQIYTNVHSGQNKGWLLRIQFKYTAIHFIRHGYNWQGPSFGFNVPVEISGCEKLGYRGRLLPALDMAVPQYPKWYRWLDKKLSYRFSFKYKDLTTDI